MKNLNNIAEELFNKIRGRFPKVTIGDADSVITNEPGDGRFFDFEMKNGEKVNVSIDEEKLTVMYNNKMSAMDSWYDFLRELRQFSKKRMLDFDTRDITKANLDKSDYEYLSRERSGEKAMSESKMYGTSRTSFQNIGNARMVVKHSAPVNQELASGRSQKIHSIYVENEQGERFKYPYKHLNGARAVARHVAEGGNLYDDIGQHIVGLSEELNKLRKFKTYMNRSTVMAEGLSGYMDVVFDRIATVKKTIESLQKENSYKQFVETFEPKDSVEVPEDVQSDWIDQLTIRQFNEELKDVFPYVYKLVSEANAIDELGPEDLMDEGERHGNSKMYDKCWDGYKKVPGKKRGEKGSCVKEEDELERGFEEMMGQFSEADMDFGDKTKELSMWLAKYDEYKGTNGDALPMGWIKAMTSTGVMSDGYEQDELIAFEKKIGKEEIEWEDDDYKEFIKPENSPITNKMYDELAKIIGTKDRSEEVADAVSSALGMGESVEDSVQEDELPKSSKVLKLVIDDLKKFKAEQEEAKKQGYDEDVKMMQGRIDDMMDIAKLIKDGGYLSGVDTAVQDVIVDYYEKAGEPLPFAKEGNAGDESTLEKEEQKTPLGEFILSYFDRENGQFPKGETAVLTMVEKDYGEQFIEPAKQFIEAINDKIAEVQGYKEADGFGTVREDDGFDDDHPMPSILKYDKQTDVTKALRAAARLPDDAPVYFDDADLVYGDKTVWSRCGVDDNCTFGDAAKALKKFAKNNPVETESGIEEGQYDGKSREELLKMKAQAEADIKNYKSQGDQFYDETQMMMAQQHLKDIMKALAKVGEEADMEEGRYDDGGLGVVEKLLQGITKDFVMGDDSAAQKMVDMLKKYNAPMDKVADMLEQNAKKLTKKTFGIFDNPLKKDPAGKAADRMSILADYIRDNARQSEELNDISRLAGL